MQGFILSSKTLEVYGMNRLMDRRVFFRSALGAIAVTVSAIPLKTSPSLQVCSICKQRHIDCLHPTLKDLI